MRHGNRIVVMATLVAMSQPRGFATWLPWLEYKCIEPYLRRYRKADWGALARWGDKPGMARLWANHALVLAVEHRYGRGNHVEEIDQLLAVLCDTYPEWGKGWTSPLPGYSMTLTTWLMQNEGSQMRGRARKVIGDLADYWTLQPVIQSREGDTGAEVNAWTAGFLAMAWGVFPGSENAATWDASATRAKRWETAARRFARNTLSTEADVASGYAEVASVGPDWLIINHGWDHPSYALASVAMGDGGLAYIRNGFQVPEEFKHNVWEVYRRYRGNIDVRTGKFKNCPLADDHAPKGLDDWGVDGQWQNNCFAYLNYLALRHEYRFESVSEYWPILVMEVTSLPYSRKSVYIRPEGLQAPNAGKKGYSPKMRWLLDSICARRHAVAFLLAMPMGGGNK